MPVPAAFAIVVLVWSTTPLAVKWSSGGGVTFLEGVALRMVAGALLASLLIRAFGLTRDYSAAACRMYASGALGFFGAMGKDPLIHSPRPAPVSFARGWQGMRSAVCLIANKRRMTPSRRAQRPGPEGVWPKPRHTGVARLDRGPCHGAAPGALL